MPAPSSTRANASRRCKPARFQRTHALALGALLAIAGLASAQTLNLTPPATPQPGDHAAAITLAISLEEEASRIRNGRSKLGADAFDVAVRELAARVLRDSDTPAGSARPDASRRVVLAMTLARRSDDLGAWFDAFTPPVPAIEAAASDLNDLSNRASELDADALCRGVRSALAPVWPRTSRVYAAWTPDTSFRAQIAQATSIAPAPDWLAPGAAAALDRLSRLVNSASSSPAHAHAARLTAYREAAAREIASAPPATFDPAATQALRDAYAAAIHAAAPKPGVAADSLPLARLAKVAALARDASALPPAPGPRNLAPDPARALGANLIGLLAEPAPASLRRLDVAAALVHDATPDPIDEKTLPRQLRVVLRQLQPAAVASRTALLETAVRVLDPATSLSDPAVLGARSIHRNRVNDLTLLSRAAGALVEPRDADAPIGPEGPRIRPDRNAASAYLLRLGQDLGKAELRDAALVTLRETCQTIAAAWATPSEGALRQSSDERERRIVARLDAARAAYLLALADPRRRDIEAPAAELRAIGAALTLRDECELDPQSLARLIDWPGFELTPRTIEALRAQGDSATDAAIDAIAIDMATPMDATAALAAITGARDQARPWRVVASIARDAAAQDAGPDLSNAPAGATSFPFAECGAGAPDPAAWMHEHVDDLADFCRWAEEWAMARAGKDAKAAPMFDRAMRAAAARVGVD
jgi:hypothetical protein